MKTMIHEEREEEEIQKKDMRMKTMIQEERQEMQKKEETTKICFLKKDKEQR